MGLPTVAHRSGGWAKVGIPIATVSLVSLMPPKLSRDAVASFGVRFGYPALAMLMLALAGAGAGPLAVQIVLHDGTPRTR
jgi:hypothetical protein